KRLDDKKLQIQECKVQEVKASGAISEDKAQERCMKSIDERAHHKKEYDIRVNERQMQTTEEKVDTSKALNASLVDTKSSGTELVEQDTSNRSKNDSHADDAYIRLIYEEEPMAEV
nr:hypothetical protein [Tanacetum cinerariifolium]